METQKELDEYIEFSRELGFDEKCDVLEALPMKDAIPYINLETQCYFIECDLDGEIYPQLRYSMLDELRTLNLELGIK